MTFILGIFFILLITSGNSFEENQKINSGTSVAIVGISFVIVFIISGCMFSFYCCGKMYTMSSPFCCCCPSRSDDESEKGVDSIGSKNGEKDKLISSEDDNILGQRHRPPHPLISSSPNPRRSSISGQRPPHPLIPSTTNPRRNSTMNTEEEDDSDREDKVKRITLPTNPSIKITTSSGTPKRSRSPSPSTNSLSRSRSSSPRAPAFDIVTNPSNPLLRMK